MTEREKIEAAQAYIKHEIEEGKRQAKKRENASKVENE